MQDFDPVSPSSPLRGDSPEATDPGVPPVARQAALRRRRRWLAIACLAAAGSGALMAAGFAQTKSGALPPTPPSATAEPRVFVHYMPWFKAEKLANGKIDWEHWQWFGKGEKHDPDDILENGRRDIASIYYPSIGPYDGRDAAVLDYHMLTAKAAGVDGFIADWYGPADHSDKVFAAMVKAAERCGMRVAICLEEKTFFPPYTSAANMAGAKDAMEAQLRHVLATHAASPAYLRHHGQPVFFIFKNYGASGGFAPADFGEVLSRLEDSRVLLVRGAADPAYYDVAGGSYLWCPDGSNRDDFYRTAKAAFEAGKIDYWVGGAYPGFDDHGCWGWGNGPRVVERRGTQLYEETLGEVLKYRPPFVQISTWNDFEEGTTIEPAEPYGFTFIDATEEFVGKFTGRRVDLGDNQWPLRLYELRRKIETLEDPEAKARWTSRVDRYSRAFADGSRFLMGWRLRNLEAGVREEIEAAADVKKQIKQESGEKS